MTCVQGAGWRNVCGRVSMSSLVALVLSALGSLAPLQAQEPIKIGFGVSLTGGPRLVGQSPSAVQANLGRGDQRQGWAARPSGEARLFRRPDQRRQCSRHLLQAHGRRQGRPADGACHQSHRRRHAAHHGAQEDGHGAAGARLQCGVQLSEIFPERAIRAGLEGRPLQCVFRGRKIDQAGAEDRGARRRGCRILQQRADRRPREREEIRPPDRL